MALHISAIKNKELDVKSYPKGSKAMEMVVSTPPFLTTLSFFKGLLTLISNSLDDIY